MNYTYVNNLDYTTSSNGNSPYSTTGSGGPDSSIVLTAGNLAIAVFQNADIVDGVGTLSDSLGNAYAQQGYVSNAGGTASLVMFAGVVSVGGTATFEVTGFTGNQLSGIGIAQYRPASGYVFAPNAAVFGGYYVNGNATGTNAIVAPSSAVTVPAGTYMLFGANSTGSQTTANTAGTSPIAFTGEAAMWNNGTAAQLIVEDAQIASTGGTYQVTFGSTTIKQSWTLFAAFQLFAGPFTPFTQTQFFVTDTIIQQ